MNKIVITIEYVIVLFVLAIADLPSAWDFEALKSAQNEPTRSLDNLWIEDVNSCFFP